MRTLLKMTIPVEAGNKAIQDGTIAKLMGKLQEDLKPEASYFFTEHGKRTAFWFFDMKDPSQIPVIAEPLYMDLNADVTFTPVMNAQDLQAGLQQWAKASQLVGAH